MPSNEMREMNRGMAGAQPELLRALGAWESAAIVIGVMIGSAIFIVPAEITREVGSERMALLVWGGSGLLSLFGALTFAEMAAMLPMAGGQYVYLREAYGPLVGFLCGWTYFLAEQSGSIATVAVGFAQYLGDFVRLSLWQQKFAAAAAVALLTAINVRGVREGGLVQSVLTGLKVGAMVALIVLGYLLVHGVSLGPTRLSPVSGRGAAASFGVAMVAALWAYDGWNNVTFAAGEVKNPQRSLPAALIAGTAVVVAIYLGLNLVYYHVLPLEKVAASPRVAADAARVMFGSTGASLVTLAIIVCMFGSMNGMVLAGARIYYAMAVDGLFFRWSAAVHPRFRTPHLALIVQGCWAIALVLAGSYEQLFTYVMFTGWIFYALTGLAVFVLRRKMPGQARPYRVWGYPVVPLLFVITGVWFVSNTLVEKPVEAGWGSLIVGLGIPVYFLWKK